MLSECEFDWFVVRNPRETRFFVDGICQHVEHWIPNRQALSLKRRLRSALPT